MKWHYYFGKFILIFWWFSEKGESEISTIFSSTVCYYLQSRSTFHSLSTFVWTWRYSITFVTSSSAHASAIQVNWFLYVWEKKRNFCNNTRMSIYPFSSSSASTRPPSYIFPSDISITTKCQGFSWQFYFVVEILGCGQSYFSPPSALYVNPEPDPYSSDDD